MTVAQGVEQLTRDVKARALALGFARVGIARAEALAPEGERLHRWLASGHHASMTWMERTEQVRVDPTDEGMLPSARSIVVAAAPYIAGSGDAARKLIAPGRVAAYARGHDYHDVLYAQLRPLRARLRELGYEARAAVDSMPVFERAWAERAGVGFVGKNCCLIVPGLGSHVFLAAIVTSAELQPDEPLPERCGNCRLCLDACPTRAFAAERQLDARRCVSYLTIEHHGPIDEALREGVGDRIFGCDACQDVCPFNATAQVRAPVLDALASDASRPAFDAVTLLHMDEATFAARVRGTPLSRPKREGMARNAALVLGNAGDGRALPVLQRAAASDSSATVRDAAAWAVEQLRNRGIV